jgi:Response regulator containing CheY-like receiver domain and AraC-type DNA-binding domain
MIRLLIVDDEQATRDGLLNHVDWRDLGVDIVKTADDGLQALQISDSYKPDIVLTDVKMPRMDGIQFAMKLKERLPQCIILFLSSYAEKEYLKSAIHLKALDFLEKPVNLSTIQEHIRAAVQVCNNERELRKAEMEIRNGNELLRHEQQALYWIAPHNNDDNVSKINAGIEMPPGSAIATAIVKLHNLTDSDFRIVQAHKYELIETIIKQFAVFGLETRSGFKDAQHLIIHAYSKKLAAPEELVNPLALVRTDLQALIKKQLFTFIGIGLLVHRPERLLESYHTAAVAVQRQFFSGYNQITVYNERSTPPANTDYEDELSAVFSSCLEEEKHEAANEALTRITTTLKENEDYLVNNAKNVYFALLLTLFRIADKKKVQLSEAQDDKEYLWSVLFRFNTLQETVNYTEEKLNYFFEQLRSKSTGGSNSNRIFKFIHDNYKDADLSIKSIADYLFLTPNYLSLQFKKETGTTINQYITEYRIEKAKEYLADRRFKLYEIAALVGIQDANYFAKTFKKVTGLTPSEFKEKRA